MDGKEKTRDKKILETADRTRGLPVTNDDYSRMLFQLSYFEILIFFVYLLYIVLNICGNEVEWSNDGRGLVRLVVQLGWRFS